MRRSSRDIRRGFTLLELMVAITIAAGLMLGGRLVFEQVITAADGLQTIERTTAVDRRDRFILRTLFRNIESGSDTTVTVTGTEQSMTFTSWCMGELSDSLHVISRCTVALSIDTTLVVRVSTDPTPHVLHHDSIPGHLIYLMDAHGGGRWSARWTTDMLAPAAVGVVFGTDTTVLRIGDRG